MKISLIGLGNMGHAMAMRLVELQRTIAVFSRSPEKRKAFEGTTATVLQNMEDAGDSDVVITMVSDDKAVSEISDILIPRMKKGSIHLSMSTISPATSTTLSGKSRKAGIHYVAAPVLGRPPAAGAGKLFILASGDQASKARLTPLLSNLGQRTIDFGEEPGAANAVKLIFNYQIFVITQMLSESMLFAERSGIDKQLLLDTMTNTIFGSPVFSNYGKMIVEEKDIPDGFTTKLASKDLRLLLETARSEQMRVPLGEVIDHFFAEIIGEGNDEKDVTTLVTHLRRVISIK